MADITATPPAAAPPRERPGEDAARRAIDDAREIGSALLAAARDGGAAALDEQRLRAAGELAAVGEVLHRAAESLEPQTGAAVARYTETAACRLDALAVAVRERPWRELSGDIEELVRRWPLASLAVAIGIGLVAGRVMLAPAPPRQDEPAARPSAPPHSVPDSAASDSGGGAVADEVPAGSGSAAEKR